MRCWKELAYLLCATRDCTACWRKALPNGLCYVCLRAEADYQVVSVGCYLHSVVPQQLVFSRSLSTIFARRRIVRHNGAKLSATDYAMNASAMTFPIKYWFVLWFDLHSFVPVIMLVAGARVRTLFGMRL